MDRPSSTSSSNRRHRLRAVIITLVALVLIEIVFNIVLPESEMVAHFARARQEVVLARDIDFEVFGDSVGRSGLWPHVLAEELGGDISVENFSLPGSGPLISYFLFQDQIASGNAPQYVVYTHAPHTYSGVRYGVVLGSFCTWAESFALLRAGNPYDVILGIFNRLSYTLRYREQFKKLLHGNASFFTEDHKPVAGREWYEWAQDNIKRHDFSGPLHEFYDKPFTVSELNEMAIRSFISLAAENDVTVLWVTMPVPRSVYDHRKRTGFQDDYYTFVDSLICDNLVMVQREFAVYEDETFFDASHFNAEGGIEFSRRLASRIAPLISN